MSNENATESASGSIFFELDLKLTSDSGRAKHLDVNEQGDWIAEYMWRMLQESMFEMDPKDIAIPEMRYWGTDIKSETGPIRIFKTS
jgi:hypothetical protein